MIFFIFRRYVNVFSQKNSSLIISNHIQINTYISFSFFVVVTFLKYLAKNFQSILFECLPGLFSSIQFTLQLREADTARAIFKDNIALCNEVSERVVQHFVHCIETHGQHVQYLRFLQTIVKCEDNYIRKCQDVVMAEVSSVQLVIFTVS